MMARSPADLLRPGNVVNYRRPDQAPPLSQRTINDAGGGHAAAGDRSNGYRPGRADYPAVLLTRRLFGLESDRILSTRANAPRACRQRSGQQRLRRPPT